MKLAISRAAFLAAASVCMGKADVRYYLNGIHIEKAPDGFDGVLIVATDGHRLFCAHDENAEYLNDWPAEITIKFGKESVRAFKLAKNLDLPAFLKLDGDKVTLEVRDSVCNDGELIDGKFPDWHRVVKDAKGKVSGAWFNATYLADFEKINRFLSRGAKYPAMTIRQDDVTSSAVVQFGQTYNAFGVLMPMRGEGPTELPKWAVGPFKVSKKEKAAA